MKFKTFQIADKIDGNDRNAVDTASTANLRKSSESKVRVHALSRFSRGGTYLSRIWTQPGRQGKIWNSLQAFVSHLALITNSKEKLSKTPQSLFDVYGNAYVVETVVDDTLVSTNIYPFIDWYAQYWSKSDKFSSARRIEREKAKNQKKPPKVKPVLTTSPSDLANTIAANTAARQEVSTPWSEEEKKSVSRVVNTATHFVSGLKNLGIVDNSKVGNACMIEIDGVKYVICKLV
jgi:hypothetical protein